MRKCIVKARPAPWLNETSKSLMKERDEAKLVKSGLVEDRFEYCQLRNQVTKLNRSMKKEYYMQRINAVKQDGKELWKTLNEIMGGASFVDSEGMFLTKPSDTANYFNDFFINKVYALRQNMDNTDSDYLKHIKNNVMLDKNCTLLFSSVDEWEVRKFLPEHSSVGTDMLDSKVLGLAADYVYAPICHILNAWLMKGVYPTVWKEGKIIPLPKYGRQTLRNTLTITV